MGERDGMRLDAQTAVIEARKLRDYLLSLDHPDGSSKARYLEALGYVQASWTRLEADLREQILTREARPLGRSLWGRKYEILGILTGPNGRMGGVRSVWIVRHGEAHPRLVTLTPWRLR